MGQNDALGQAGSAISMYISDPTGAPGKLTIDPDHVETFIKYMEQALAKLVDVYRQSYVLMDVVPPGDDPFSPTAVDDIQRTAGEQMGGHLYANARAQETYRAIISNLRASLAAYRDNEAQGTERFREGG